MPAASDLVKYLSANRPEDDASTSGGAQDANARPVDTQVPDGSPEDLDVVSDDAGDTTQTLTITYRRADGTVGTATPTLNGTTPVTAVAGENVERILEMTLASAATGTITVSGNTSATTFHAFAPGETDAKILFYGASSDPSVIKTRYEKEFWENTHATEALLSAEVELTADPNSIYEMGVAGAKDDTESVANRETAPTGETFVDDGVAQSVPGTDLLAGEAIGVWIKQTLAAGAAAAKPTFTTQLSGSSA